MDMDYEIGDSIKFSKNCVHNLWQKGFVVAIINVKSGIPSHNEYGIVVISESGEIITMSNGNGIHIFSDKLFNSSRVVLCEKVIVDESKITIGAVKGISLNLLNDLVNRH